MSDSNNYLSMFCDLVKSILKLGLFKKKISGGGGGGGGGERRQAIYFLWVVGAEIFQIIWVIGVRPNLITWVVGVSLC